MGLRLTSALPPDYPQRRTILEASKSPSTKKTPFGLLMLDQPLFMPPSPAQDDVFESSAMLPPDGQDRFVVIGDSGTGTKTQFNIAGLMSTLHDKQHFNYVLTLGDNVYKDAIKSDTSPRSGDPQLFDKRIREPYAPLMKAGVKFLPVLGNHDVKYGQWPEQLHYWNVPQCYSFKLGHPGSEVEFFALDTTLLMHGEYGCHKENAEAEPAANLQLEWLKTMLAKSTAPMKVVYGHYPMFSHSTATRPKATEEQQERARVEHKMQKLLAPMFEEYGVDLYLSGHEHHYEKPHQVRDVYYGVSGGAGQLEDDPDEIPKEFDNGDTKLLRQCHFMSFQITPEGLAYKAISEEGKEIDAGFIPSKKQESLSLFHFPVPLHQANVVPISQLQHPPETLQGSVLNALI